MSTAVTRRVSGKRGECSGTSLCLSAALCCSLQAPGSTLTVVQKLGAVSRVFGVLAQLVSSLLLYMFDLDHFFLFYIVEKKKAEPHMRVRPLHFFPFQWRPRRPHCP